MGGFFKSFGKGILYLFVLPFLLIILALYGIYGLCGFIFLFIKSIVLFFTGRNLDDDLPEDKEVKRILYGEPQLEVEVSSPIVEEEKREEFSVYHPEVDPFSVRSANEDPYKPSVPLQEENTLREDTAIKEELIQGNINDSEVIQSSLDDLLEEPNVGEENIPNIQEEIPQEHSSDFESISTSDIDETNVYKPRGSEELLSIDDDNDLLDEDNSIGISFDDM